jgi:hypothetical protein
VREEKARRRVKYRLETVEHLEKARSEEEKEERRAEGERLEVVKEKEKADKAAEHNARRRRETMPKLYNQHKRPGGKPQD